MEKYLLSAALWCQWHWIARLWTTTKSPVLDVYLLNCCVESIDDWLSSKKKRPILAQWMKVSHTQIPGFYLVKCYSYSVVTENMVCLNIYYKSFSLTKNVKVEFSRWSLQFHMYNVPGNSCPLQREPWTT